MRTSIFNYVLILLLSAFVLTACSSVSSKDDLPDEAIQVLEDAMIRQVSWSAVGPGRDTRIVENFSYRITSIQKVTHISNLSTRKHIDEAWCVIVEHNAPDYSYLSKHYILYRQALLWDLHAGGARGLDWERVFPRVGCQIHGE